MSLTRYAPQLGQAFGLLPNQPVTLARCAAPWLAVAAGIHAAGKLVALPGGPVIPFLVTALCMGAFAVGWQRFTVLGETPKGPVGLTLGLRALGWAVVYQMFLGFEAVVNQLFVTILAGATKDAQVLALAGTELFQLLLGPMFLMLPHAALWVRGSKGPTLQEMVIAGGLAVGMGYVLANLPFVLANMTLDEFVPMLPAGPAAEAGVAALRVVISFLAVAVMSAYFALVWKELRASAPTATPAEAEPVPAKERRTHRLSKKKR